MEQIILLNKIFDKLDLISFQLLASEADKVGLVEGKVYKEMVQRLIESMGEDLKERIK